MFCGNCGNELVNPGKFCENCGHEIEITKVESGVQIPQPLEQNASNFIQQPYVNQIMVRPPMSKATKVAIACGAGLLILLIAFFSIFAYFSSVSNPKSVAKEVFYDVMKGNYSEAFNKIYLPESEFLTKESFVKCFEGLEKQPEAERFTVEKVTDSDNGNKKIIQFTYYKKGSTEKNSDDMTLVKADGKKFFFFSNWKLDMEGDGVISEWDITVPKGAKLSIEGKEIGSTYLKETFPADNYSGITDGAEKQVYAIKNIFDREYEVKATLEGGVDYTGKVYSSSSQDITIEPDENFQYMIKESLNTYYQNRMQALNNLDATYTQDDVVPDSAEQQNLISTIQSLASDTYYKYTYALGSIDFNNIYLDDAEHAKLEVVVNKNYTQTYNKSKKTSYTYNDSPSVTCYLKRVDGKWVVYYSY
jgi:hypothetical protein